MLLDQDSTLMTLWRLLKCILSKYIVILGFNISLWWTLVLWWTQAYIRFPGYSFHFCHWKRTNDILDLGVITVCSWNMLNDSCWLLCVKAETMKEAENLALAKVLLKMWHHMTQDTLSSCVQLQSWEWGRKERGGLSFRCLKTAHGSEASYSLTVVQWG